jgi:hypothetical protein
VQRLGLDALLADALLHREVAWFLPGKAHRVHRLPAPALGLSRHTLDARLAREFTRLGGDLRTQSRHALSGAPPGRVLANGRRRALQSRWIGLKCHVRDFELVRELEVHLGNQCYLGLSRVETGAVNACGLFRRHALAGRGPELLLAYLRNAGLEPLASRLARATFVPESFSAVAAVEFDRAVPRSDRVRIGDASAMIAPFTGNGMAMAFQSAEIALSPLLHYATGSASWADTCRTINDALRRRFRLRLASARALHPFLLQPPRQRWLAALSRGRILPFRALYATLH